MTTEGAPVPDRRRKVRFPFRATMRYTFVNSKRAHHGGGKTVDVSSSGVAFTTSQPLPVGRVVQIAVEWPAQLDEKCPLQLVVRGRIVRVNGTVAAINIDSYVFKLRTAGGQSRPWEMTVDPAVTAQHRPVNRVPET